MSYRQGEFITVAKSVVKFVSGMGVKDVATVVKDFFYNGETWLTVKTVDGTLVHLPDVWAVKVKA